jgi:hypothetical protein
MKRESTQKEKKPSSKESVFFPGVGNSSESSYTLARIPPESPESHRIFRISQNLQNPMESRRITWNPVESHGIS